MPISNQIKSLIETNKLCTENKLNRTKVKVPSSYLKLCLFGQNKNFLEKKQ